MATRSRSIRPTETSTSRCSSAFGRERPAAEPPHRRRRSGALAVVILTLGLAGLLAGAPASTAQTSDSSDAQASAAGAVSPLKRRDLPPEGVDQMFPFGAGDISGCVIDPKNGVSLGYGNPPAQCVFDVGDTALFELRRFPADQGLRIQLTRSDGSTDQAQVPAGMSIWRYTILPGAPTGSYKLTAAAGSARAEGSFVVQRPSQPHVNVVPAQGAPGTAFQILLAGFPPGQAVPLQLYRAYGSLYVYLTDLPSASTNDQGEAIVDLPTAPDDPQALYRVETSLAPINPLTGGFNTVVGDQPPPSYDGLMQAVIQQADRFWASVVAHDGQSPDRLACYYAGAALDRIRADVQAMRSSGQYHEARLTTPVAIGEVRVTKTDPALDRPITLEFTATEQWNDRLFDASGSLMEDRSGSRAWHYVISSAADLLPSGSAASSPATQCSGLSQWLIVDALPSTP